MRIDFVVPGLNTNAGGTTRVVSQLARSLASLARANVRVIYQMGGGCPGFEPCGNLQFLGVPCGGGGDRVLGLGFARQLDRLLRGSFPDLMHSHGLWLPVNRWSTRAYRIRRVVFVVSTHGMLEPWALQHRALKKRLAWILYQRRDLLAARVLHATAEQEADNLRKLGLRQPIAVIPNGVELAGLGAGLKWMGRGAAERRDEAGRTALFLSRIHPIKGLLPLVEAWDRLRPAGWRVIIAGPDEAGHRREVVASLRQKGLESAFEFVGAVDGEAKTALYRSADLFVLPTFSENFGVVVAEALACGVPVITTKGAPWQGLETHQCGWWIDIGVDPLVEALRQATSAPSDVLQSMGARGRVYAENSFGWPGIAEQMLSVYRWMLGEQEKPDCVRLD